MYFSGFGLGPLHLKSLRLCDDGTRSRSIWYFSYPIVTKVTCNGKSQKYLEFNGPKLFLIGEWCKARMHLKREGDVGFLVERIEHQQRLNASGPDGVSSSHHISALIFGNRQRLFNRF